MKIRSSDYKGILDYLVQESWIGNRLVAFPDTVAPVEKEDLACFETVFEAKQYCYEMSTDIDFYQFKALKSMYRAMTEALKDKDLLIVESGLVNITAMVEAREKRIENEMNNNQNKKVMIIEKNFEFLRDQIKHAGFGESLEYALREKMGENNEKFALEFKKEYGNNRVEASLNFKKGTEGDLYFFNTYDVKLIKGNGDPAVEQTFFNNNNRNTITLKEAYNLMDGRSVNKEMISQDKQEYNVWLKLDFKNTDERGNFKIKQFGEKYGYDLESTLQKHPIKELQNEEYKKDLIDSIKKGNIQSATFIKGGQEVKQYIEANPQYKGINLYDANMQKLESRQSQGEKQGESQGQSSRKDNSKGQLGEENEPGRKETKKRGQSI